MQSFPIKALFTPQRHTVEPSQITSEKAFHYSLPVWHETGDGQLEDPSELASLKLLLEGGEVLVSKLNPEKGAVVHAVAKDVPVIGSTEFIALKPKLAHGRFGYWLMQSAPVRMQLEASIESVTNSHKRARVDKFLASRVQVPDLPTQKRIAAFLDSETARIDELIAKKERLVEVLGERLNTRRNVAFRQIHSSLYRPLRWLIAQICDGPFGSGLTSAHYTENGVRVIRLQNIKDGGFDGTDTAFISEEHYASLGDHDVNSRDLLVAGLGDEKNRVGRACIAPDNLGPAMVKADCYRVRLNPKLIAHSFAAEYLCSDESWTQIYALAKGVTRSRLNLGNV